ncbi:MAG: DUF1559 domain-containing protein [Planctomycetia bacterium]|nr:DUF1559 domain-containing protein [Planctomycetia bacterium]
MTIVQIHSASSRRAFTLVELLVVIAIIGVLVGLLMPAIVNARLTALQTVCANNQKELATAIALYDSNKDRLPYVGRGDNNTRLTTWYDQILEELGQGQQYQDLIDGQISNTNNTPPLKQFKCPVSDAPVQGFSYVVNVGKNNASWSSDLGNNPTKAVRAYGLFFYFDKSNNNYRKSSISSIKDGAANTILLSEKCYKRIPGNTLSDVTYSPYETWAFRPDKNGTYLRFGLYWNDGTNANNNSNFPSSRHSQVNNIAFADTSVRAISKSIMVQTYRSLMCPSDNDANVTMPSNDANYQQ